MIRILPLICTAALLLNACATPSATDNADPQFGASVRNMIEQQIYNPRAAAQPGIDPPLLTDGERGVESLKSYRAQTSAPIPPADNSTQSASTPSK